MRGSGNVARHIVLEDLSTFDEGDVHTLILLALARSKVPLDPKQKRRLKALPWRFWAAPFLVRARSTAVTPDENEIVGE